MKGRTVKWSNPSAPGMEVC